MPLPEFINRVVVIGMLPLYAFFFWRAARYFNTTTASFPLSLVPGFVANGVVLPVFSGITTLPSDFVSVAMLAFINVLVVKGIYQVRFKVALQVWVFGFGASLVVHCLLYILGLWRW